MDAGACMRYLFDDTIFHIQCAPDKPEMGAS